MLRCGGDELRSADDVGDTHEMVVDDVCKIVCRHPVPFDENLILKLIIVYRDVAVNNVMERRCARKRHLLTDNVWVACIKMRLDFFLGEVAAVAVIALVFTIFMRMLRIAEAAVRKALLNELLRIFFVNFLTLTLNVRAAVAADVRTFIRNYVSSIKSAFDEINSVRHKACTVRILNAENECAVICLSEKITIECCPKIADMHIPRRTRSKACTYLCQNHDLQKFNAFLKYILL